MSKIEMFKILFLEPCTHECYSVHHTESIVDPIRLMRILYFAHIKSTDDKDDYLLGAGFAFFGLALFPDCLDCVDDCDDFLGYIYKGEDDYENKIIAYMEKAKQRIERTKK